MQRQESQALTAKTKNILFDMLNPFVANIIKWKLPDELLFQISMYFTYQDLIRLLAATARSSKDNNRLFKPYLDLLKLAHFLVVKPNEKEVIKIITANPEALEKVIPLVEVRSMKIINYKPYQLAHGSYNDWMCAAIKEAMIKIYGGEEAATTVIQKQIAEKFPEDKEKDDAIKNKLAAILEEVMQAIDQEQFNLGKNDKNKLILSPATYAAIEKCRKELDELHPTVIEMGMHYRTNTLQEIYDEYVKAAGRTRWNYDSYKCALFADGVIAAALEMVKLINVTEDFSQGLWYLQGLCYQQEKKEERRGTLKLRDDNVNFYDSLTADSPDFALSGSCLNIIFGLGRVRSSDECRAGVVGFKTYVEQKQQILQNLFSSTQLRDSTDAQLSKEVKFG